MLKLFKYAVEFKGKTNSMDWMSLHQLWMYSYLSIQFIDSEVLKPNINSISYAGFLWKVFSFRIHLFLNPLFFKVVHFNIPLNLWVVSVARAEVLICCAQWLHWHSGGEFWNYKWRQKTPPYQLSSDNSQSTSVNASLLILSLKTVLSRHIA